MMLYPYTRRPQARWPALAGFVFSTFLPCAVAPVSLFAQDLRTPLSASEVRDSVAAIDQMRQDPRGPYSRIRWTCADGSVHPPAGTPCRERGGGSQFAEHNDAATRLATRGVYTGTILQGLDWEEFWDAPRDHHRLKAYVLEHYLAGIDDGWVLRGARYYRGARQIEDEERQGQAFLERLLSDSFWTRRHFLLASQLVSVVPHLTPGRRVSTPAIRNLATELAGLDEHFQPLRVKIHSFPSPEDLDRVAAELSADRYGALVRAKLAQLHEELRGHYDRARLAEQLSWFRQNVGSVLAAELAAVETVDSVGAIASLTRTIRTEVTNSTDGRRNLVLMDLTQLLQERAFVLAQASEGRPVSRLGRLESLGHFVTLAVGAGLLSEREQAVVTDDIAWLHDQVALPAHHYKTRLDHLAASIDWSVATVNQTFGPSVRRYAEVEPKAYGFVDSLVRGSILLPLSARVDELMRDLNRFLGQSHTVFGQQINQGVSGLNPGVALRPLEILEPGAGRRLPAFDAATIYALQELPSEMGPVAGVLTLDQGNLLSHVQLLARNLGIPNASIPGSVLPDLQRHRGEHVFFAVSPFGQVLLKDPSDLTDAERDVVDVSRAVSAERIELDTTRLRLDETRPILLSDLGAGDAGITVGPKAANLGELARRFPHRVSTGVALPFGMYRQHVDRPYESGRTLHEEIQRTLRRAEQLRAAGGDEEEIERLTLERLAVLRQAIIDLDWIPEMQEAIGVVMREAFGEDLRHGVFVRSDTNAEDLPQFTGAGLNLTVPHQTTEASIFEAIKTVWASPLRERPYRWRTQMLSNQEHIYPSVLLLRSIPSEKSGVLITSGLQFGGPDHLTIVTAEGVGGAVDGEPGETLLVDANGGTRLLSQAKASSYRTLADDGASGIRWVYSSRDEVVLTGGEVDQLVQTIEEWRRGLPAPQRSVVWDMEFGFVDGQLWLFQIRPFVPHRSVRLYEQLRRLDGEVLRRAGRTINLEETYAFPE